MGKTFSAYTPPCDCASSRQVLTPVAPAGMYALGIFQNNMPHYKRQHYLPAAYLRYFSCDQTNCTRDALIWRLDGKTQRQVPVKSQCFEDYIYSRLKPAETESKFRVVEDHYCQCVNKIKAGKPLTSLEGGNLLMAMFDFHLRNAVHKNSTGKEGIEAYELRTRIFLSGILLGRKGDVTREDISTHIETHWALRIISNRPGHAFITSDHPSAWITINSPRPALHMVMLPITPTQVAIAYDRRILQIISDQITAEDELTINAAQLDSAVECVYASGFTTEEQLDIVADHFKRKTPSVCESSEDGWTLKMQGLPSQHFFSFMRTTSKK
jgi:hypothetical protein